MCVYIYIPGKPKVCRILVISGKTMFFQIMTFLVIPTKRLPFLIYSYFGMICILSVDQAGLLWFIIGNIHPSWVQCLDVSLRAQCGSAEPSPIGGPCVEKVPPSLCILLMLFLSNFKLIWVRANKNTIYIYFGLLYT